MLDEPPKKLMNIMDSIPYQSANGAPLGRMTWRCTKCGRLLDVEPTGIFPYCDAIQCPGGNQWEYVGTR